MNMDHFELTLQDAQAKLRQLENQVIETKRGINTMLKLFGREPLYADAELEVETATPAASGKDRFYGQPLAKVVRWVLEDRKTAGDGPASVSQIYEAMIAGNYKFDSDGPENAKRGLRISLTKNSTVFHKLPNGEYGLRSWYPAIKDKPVKSRPAEGNDAETNNGEPDAGAELFDFPIKEKEADAPLEKTTALSY
jgi:hypothetical protein